MRYASGASFRRALEDRLRRRSLETGHSLARLRKLVAFDRLLSRLLMAFPDTWVLKGGVSLQLRLGERARTTKDVDLLWRRDPSLLHEQLFTAVNQDANDWFTFQIASPTQSPDPELSTLRFQIQSLLDSRAFERFSLDVGLDDQLIGQIEEFPMPALLTFAGFEPTMVPCYPVAQQIAEKLHAYTYIYTSGPSSRVKDLVDIMLLAELTSPVSNQLHSAIEAVFGDRSTHPHPTELPAPPTTWRVPFRTMAAEVGLSTSDLAECFDAVGRFLNPILQQPGSRIWNSADWSWQPINSQQE